MLLLLLAIFWLAGCTNSPVNLKPRVIVTTDINIMSGDPDDRQSMAHMLMYADELDIVSICPDRRNAGGIEATMMALDAYAADYHNSDYAFRTMAFPTPDSLKKLAQLTQADAVQSIIEHAHRDDPRPLYIAVWGNMHTLKEALFQDPTIVDKIRVFTIGTNVRWEDCEKLNWNGPGRPEIWQDARFNDMWWIEADWTYNAMFEGNEPKEMLDIIAGYGELGQHIKDVVIPYEWAHYFRVGDTPTILYLIDPDCQLDDPTQTSWAGRYMQPYPEQRPNYYTGGHGEVEWNYDNPCETWEHKNEVLAYRVSTLMEKRQEMYDSYVAKMNRLYNRGN